MKKNILNFSITAGLFLVFAIFTILVKFVDTSVVATTGTQIGLSSINKPLFDFFGANETWGTISTLLFVIAGVVVLTLATIAVVEMIKSKSLFKINHKLLLVALLYVLTAIFYVIFEFVIINYRPLLDEGLIKASYPSSHTLLICVVCLSACLIVPDYIKSNPLKITITTILCLISVLAPITRLLAGMHWFTDVVASIILSLALVMLYYSTSSYISSKKQNQKTPE